MIILEVGLEPHQVEKGTLGDPYTEIEYYIKISEDEKVWYVNRDVSYTLEDGIKKRDEMMDRISGHRG